MSREEAALFIRENHTKSIGAILCGSILTESFNKHSDIDLVIFYPNISGIEREIINYKDRKYDTFISGIHSFVPSLNRQVLQQEYKLFTMVAHGVTLAEAHKEQIERIRHGIATFYQLGPSSMGCINDDFQAHRITSLYEDLISCDDKTDKGYIYANLFLRLSNFILIRENQWPHTTIDKWLGREIKEANHSLHLLHQSVMEDGLNALDVKSLRELIEQLLDKGDLLTNSKCKKQLNIQSRKIYTCSSLLLTGITRFNREFERFLLIESKSLNLPDPYYQIETKQAPSISIKFPLYLEVGSKNSKGILTKCEDLRKKIVDYFKINDISNATVTLHEELTTKIVENSLLQPYLDNCRSVISTSLYCLNQELRKLNLPSNKIFLILQRLDDVLARSLNWDNGLIKDIYHKLRKDVFRESGMLDLVSSMKQQEANIALNLFWKKNGQNITDTTVSLEDMLVYLKMQPADYAHFAQQLEFISVKMIEEHALAQKDLVLFGSLLVDHLLDTFGITKTKDKACAIFVLLKLNE